MKNIAICVGCDEYMHLEPLRGAGGDAQRVYECLVGSPLYDVHESRLLLSPTVQQVRDALDHIARQADLGVVTLYFAGHSGMKSGTYYLCFKDSDFDRLSTTSLPIASLFAVIGEVRPRQVNVVVDACQSGGAMFDLPALAKPEVIGSADSSSIAFLAAAASDQYAFETETGGVATRALIQYVTGEKEIQQGRPYLDLVEVGLAVSRDVSELGQQNPTTWGLNLYGEGVFALNPHFSGQLGPGFAIPGIAPTSNSGAAIRTRAEELWGEYRLLATDHQPFRLLQVVASLRNELEGSFPRFIHGFATTLAARGEYAADLLAGSDALGICAVSLLPDMGDSVAAGVCRDILAQRSEIDRALCETMRERMAKNRHWLLSREAQADFHYLPIRVSSCLHGLPSMRSLDPR